MFSKTMVFGRGQLSSVKNPANDMQNEAQQLTNLKMQILNQTGDQLSAVDMLNAPYNMTRGLKGTHSRCSGHCSFNRNIDNEIKCL